MEPLGGLEKASTDFRRLMDALLLEHGEATRDAYRRDMGQFAAFIGAPNAEVAASVLVKAGPLQGNALVVRFMDSQGEAGRASSTIARRLACLKQLVRKARILGLCTWSVEVRSPRVRCYRDTRGPGLEAVRRMLEVVDQEQGALGARDRAIIRLLYDLGLRRNEVATLGMEHLEDGPPAAAWVLPKGSTERVLMTLPLPTASAIRCWLEWRGPEPGPLFHRLDSRPANMALEPLTGRAVHMVVRRVGLLAGARAWPHGLRHTAITRVLDLTNDPRAGQRFSRHASLATLQLYDDNRLDAAGHLAADLAADLDREPMRREA